LINFILFNLASSFWLPLPREKEYLKQDLTISHTESADQSSARAFESKMASVSHILVIYFLQGFVLGEPQQNALNVANVLLPYVPRGSVHTNFTLRALQGCYLWYVFVAWFWFPPFCILFAVE